MRIILVDGHNPFAPRNEAMGNHNVRLHTKLLRWCRISSIHSTTFRLPLSDEFPRDSKDSCLDGPGSDDSL